MKYFLWSSQAADKFGYAVYEIDGKIVNVTAVDDENWKENYKWDDIQLITKSDNYKFVRNIEGCYNLQV
jgi:hypothetical protein